MAAITIYVVTDDYKGRRDYYGAPDQANRQKTNWIAELEQEIPDAANWVTVESLTGKDEILYHLHQKSSA